MRALTYLLLFLAATARVAEIEQALVGVTSRNGLGERVLAARGPSINPLRSRSDTI
jgi:hypothetical protein